MLSTEALIAPSSDYYIYTPSAQAQALFLCSLLVGHFQYSPGYCLRRASLDSFLMMHVTRGFTSESSFCTAFKKETGLTPSEYRAWVLEA